MCESEKMDTEDVYFEKTARLRYFSDRNMRYIDGIVTRSNENQQQQQQKQQQQHKQEAELCLHSLSTFKGLPSKGVEDENVSQKVRDSVEMIDLCEEVEQMELSPSLLADSSAVQPSK
jgi:hypothetical protein